MNSKIMRLLIGECVRVFPAIVRSTVGGVCMWVRTDSPSTPLPKTINYLNHQQSFLMKVVGIRKRKNTHGFFSHWPWFSNFPHILILVKIMPLLNLVAAIVAGQVI